MTEEESKFHSNVLERLAILYGLQSLCKDLSNIHILIRTDSMSAMAHVNHMGGVRSKACDQVAQQIWKWAMKQHIWLSANYLPGKDNIPAHALSRNFDKSKEW